MKKGGLLKEVRSFVENMGYRLLDLKEVHFKSDKIIRFAVYKPEGVSVGDCARITMAVRDFLFLLDESEDYRVEVSSPGAERVFKSLDDYEIFANRKVHLTLKTGKTMKCLYLGLDEDGRAKFALDPQKPDSFMVVALDEIGKCRLTLE